MNENHERYGALTGLVFVVLLLVGFFLVAPMPPDVSASTSKIANYYANEQDSIRAALVVISVGLFFYVWFLGSLSSALRKLAGNPRLPTIAFGGGILSAAFIFAAITVGATATFRPEQTSAELTRTLHDIGLMAGAPAFAGFTALLGASALVIYRNDGLPKWVGGLCALGALLQPLTLGVIFTDHGAFAADGAFGLLVPFAGFVVPIIALSIVLAHEAGGEGLISRVRGALGG